MLLLGFILQADQEHPSIDFVETKVVDGFFMGVTDEFGHTNTSPDRRLCFSIWTTNRTETTNSPLHVAFPVQPEYAYRVELFDATGIAIPTTDAGKRVGIKFLDFDTNSFVLKGTGPDSAHGVEAQTIFADRKVWPYEMLIMFSPSHLFKIEKPGKYTLRLRFQILAFPQIGPNRQLGNIDLIRFPPLDYPLVKAEPAKTNAPSTNP